MLQLVENCVEMLPAAYFSPFIANLLCVCMMVFAGVVLQFLMSPFLNRTIGVWLDKINNQRMQNNHTQYQAEELVQINTRRGRYKQRIVGSH